MPLPAQLAEWQRLERVSAQSLSQSHPIQEMPQPKAIKLSQPIRLIPFLLVPTLGVHEVPLLPVFSLH